jgi:hypothetical protein
MIAEPVIAESALRLSAILLLAGEMPEGPKSFRHHTQLTASVKNEHALVNSKPSNINGTHARKDL